MEKIKTIFHNLLTDEKNEIKILISSIVIIIVFILIDFLLKGSHTKLSGYICNIATEFFGILLTYFVIQRLLNKQNISKEKQEEKAKILRYNEIISLYIDYYKRYFYCVTTPIDSRDFKNITFSNNFKLKDMCDMHKFSCLITTPLFKPAIELFYEKERELRRIFENIIFNIDFKYNNELQEIIKEFIKLSLYYDVKDSIISNQEINSGGKKTIDEVCEMLKSDYIEDHYIKYKENTLGANMATPYFMLFDLMKYEVDIINRYEELINELNS